ncbi:MAG: DUF7527 domain-containing protein [Halolamina sp.]
MQSDTVERVTEWDSEPFSDGHAGLRDLADEEFTGAVSDGHAWLFMLNGRVLGVFDGDMDRFADADGTAYAAPDQSLPLLFAMQETGGEVRGEYYSEETPMSEVDGTLQSGNFTGYVELSENVLSGDYYLVYYGGRLLPVAFVGNQQRRLTGDDAFERAADEVGIYRVTTVALDIEDVPAPETDGTAVAAAATEESTATGTTSEATADDPSEPATPSPAADESTTPAGGMAEAEPAESTETETPAVEQDSTQPEPEPDETDPEPTDPEPADDTTTAASATPSANQSRERADQSTTESETAATSDAVSGDSGTKFDAESAWRNTKTVPALDPEESVAMDTPEVTEPAEPSVAGSAEPTVTDSAELTELRGERDRLRARVEELETETERLTGERDRLERERDEAAATTEDLETEVAELRATVDELETELEAAESELSAAQEYVPDGDHELSAERAMEGTSLFVRYERKGGPTLEDAHQGDADREAVNGNIRLEHHTEFDDDGAIVDGVAFEEWLPGTIEYGFVEWLTQSFVHDVRETRNQTSMRKLFDAVPEIDRVEFRGTVDLGEEVEEESAAFDVVVRDRMGQPLIVTDLNDSRDPAAESMLESLIRNATPVGETNEGFAAAFYVTSSYYDPGALETAESATSGGLLSRGKNKSFVKLSRKDGYHLCLVETREGEFHVSVPEL